MLVKVDFPAFIGAMTAKAKKDERYYFEGVFIDPRGYLVATDGHRLFCAAVAEGAGPYIIRVIGKAPTKFDHAVFDTDDLCVSFFKDDGSPLGNLPISLIDAQYPDWKRAVDGFDVKAVEEIGVDLTLISDAAKVAKAYGKPYGRFEFHGADRAMKIHFNDSAWMSIMPCRI